MTIAVNNSLGVFHNKIIQSGLSTSWPFHDVALVEVPIKHISHLL